MEDNDARDLFLAEAALGRDAEEFFGTDLGRFVLGRCEQEIREAQAELSTVWPWRTNRIKALQAKVWRAQSFTSWMGGLITQGRQATTLLEQQEANE